MGSELIVNLKITLCKQVKTKQRATPRFRAFMRDGNKTAKAEKKKE
ncbi:hypothetical protein DDI_2770 [Dickeya dianthicola RNS04.9]|nr:hypothetical protein DDI_2770 [Dickeya dianthicola RNS04.9]